MSTNLSSDNEQFIQDAISTGLFADRNVAINAGIELLRRRQALVARLTESRRQLDQGEFTEHDPPGLRRLFEDLKARARAKSETSNAV